MDIIVISKIVFYPKLIIINNDEKHLDDWGDLSIIGTKWTVNDVLEKFGRYILILSLLISSFWMIDIHIVLRMRPTGWF